MNALAWHEPTLRVPGGFGYPSPGRLPMSRACEGGDAPCRIEAAPAAVPAPASEPGVRLYEDTDLVAVDAPHRGPMSRLVRDLVAAQSPRQRQRIVREEIDNIGFNWLSYYTVRRSPTGSLRRALLTTYAPDNWLAHYFDQHYDDMDPCQLLSADASLPLLWDIDLIEEMVNASPHGSRSRRFIKELSAHDMHSGISLQVSTPGAQPGERTVVHLVSDVPNRRWMGDRVLGDALIFGLSLHDYMTQHVRLPELNAAEESTQHPLCGTHAAPGLPALQQAVLAHVARGLTDRQIAERLNVSAHAVDYHLRQLRQRFAVRNRVQLVNAAASSLAGLLQGD